MKRSEMVSYLTKLLETFEDCSLDETAANEILEGLEHMGMIPPCLPSKELDKLNPNYLNYVSVTHDWEKE